MPDPKPVEPMHAFDELARITLADHTLTSVMHKIVELTRRTIPGAASVSVTFLEDGRATTAAHSGQLALELDERQYERGYGPCLDAAAGGEILRIQDMETETRWPVFTADARRFGTGSSMSLPVPVQREFSAAVNIYSTETHAFDEEAVELASTFAAYAGVALANMHLYEAQGRVAEQLQTAMKSRATIEQAKGVLMCARRCAAGEAFDILVKLSQDTNRKLRDVAQVVIDDALRHPE